MLVVSRKKCERVLVADLTKPDSACWVTVLEIRGDKVRLRFEAEESVTIRREEIHNAIQRKMEAA